MDILSPSTKSTSDSYNEEEVVTTFLKDFFYPDEKRSLLIYIASPSE